MGYTPSNCPVPRVRVHFEKNSNGDIERKYVETKSSTSSPESCTSFIPKDDPNEVKRGSYTSFIPKDDPNEVKRGSPIFLTLLLMAFVVVIVLVVLNEIGVIL